MMIEEAGVGGRSTVIKETGKSNGYRKQLELYFHIPFCVRKCLYCDFLSAPGDVDTKDRYMEALLTETVGSALRYADYRVTSVFIGGGTPSVVRASYIAELMDAVRAHYDLAEDAELTIEVNPGTVSGEALRTFRKAGINRLSIGVFVCFSVSMCLCVYVYKIVCAS